MNQRKEDKCCGAIVKDRLNRIILIIFSLFYLGLSGCTLARQELMQTKEDRLSGVLVVVGEQEAQRKHREEQENKTFYTMEELESSLTSSVKAEGSRRPDGSFSFEGMEGHMLGIMEEQDENESDPYIHFVNDGFFTEVKANTAETDDGRENSIKGAILASEDLKEPIYMYPVYTRADGSFYVVADGGGFLMGGVSTEGEVYSQTFQWKASEEINGKKRTDSTEIQVSFKMAVPVEKVHIRMYGHKDELLDVWEVSRDTDELTLPKETAYVIVEEETSGGGKKRSLYNWEEEQEAVTHQVHYPGNGGLLEPAEFIMKK